MNGLSHAPVNRVLHQSEPHLPYRAATGAQRYEQSAPRDIFHLDINRLVRIQ